MSRAQLHREMGPQSGVAQAEAEAEEEEEAESEAEAKTEASGSCIPITTKCI